MALHRWSSYHGSISVDNYLIYVHVMKCLYDEHGYAFPQKFMKSLKYHDIMYFNRCRSPSALDPPHHIVKYITQHYHFWLHALGATVRGLFGHINPNILIITIRVHQTIIQLLHALDKSSHSILPSMKVSYPKALLKCLLGTPMQPWLGVTTLQSRQAHLGLHYSALRPYLTCARWEWPKSTLDSRNIPWF